MHIIGAVLFGVLLGGCQSYADWRLTVAHQHQAEERANIVRMYRNCLEEHQGFPVQAKTFCEHYTQSLLAIDVRGLK